MPEYGIFQRLEDLEAEVKARNLEIPCDRDLSVLGKPVQSGETPKCRSSTSKSGEDTISRTEDYEMKCGQEEGKAIPNPPFV